MILLAGFLEHRPESSNMPMPAVSSLFKKRGRNEKEKKVRNNRHVNRRVRIITKNDKKNLFTRNL